MSREWDDGGYIRMINGSKFYPRHPERLVPDVEEIAHHLAQVNRYNGALRRPYSVGQHCLLVEQVMREHHPECSPMDRLGALMHDAEEAYLNDMTSPVKSISHEYKELGRRVRRIIFYKLGIDHPIPLVKEIDTQLRFDEMWQLAPWGHLEVDGPHYGVHIGDMKWQAVREHFLNQYQLLIEEIGNEQRKETGISGQQSEIDTGSEESEHISGAASRHNSRS